MMKVLHLTLKKKWFDMIASGDKREEYREIKPYWTKRLEGKHYDAVKFTNGYGAHRPHITLKLIDIVMSTGYQEWGAKPAMVYYVLMLGEKIDV